MSAASVIPFPGRDVVAAMAAELRRAGATDETGAMRVLLHARFAGSDIALNLRSALYEAQLRAVRSAMGAA